MRRYSLLLSVFAILIFAFPAKAHILSSFCEDQQNTADTVKCLSAALDELNQNLQTAFSEKLKIESDENSGLRENHKDWLIYRDSACSWESSQEDLESLRRARELICLTRLTQNRIDLLKLSGLTQQEVTEKIGVNARWQNALFKQNEDVYWRLNAGISADLNCNGRDENIVTGLKNVEGAGASELVLAVVEEPETGRALIRTFDLGFSEDNQAQTEKEALEMPMIELCTRNYGLEIKDVLMENATDVGADAETVDMCKSAAIHIKNAPCTDVRLFWKDDNYVLERFQILPLTDKVD